MRWTLRMIQWLRGNRPQWPSPFSSPEPFQGYDPKKDEIKDFINEAEARVRILEIERAALYRDRGTHL